MFIVNFFSFIFVWLLPLLLAFSETLREVFCRCILYIWDGRERNFKNEAEVLLDGLKLLKPIEPCHMFTEGSLSMVVI